MLIEFDEVNYLIYRYLMEQGYEHSAFAFSNEAHTSSLGINAESVPMGLLINIMQRALQMIDIELHLDSKGNLHKCSQPITFMKPHNCASIDVVNQLLPREPLRAVTVQQGERTMHCLEELPKPIITAPQRSMELIYGYNQQTEAVDELYRAQIARESQKRLQEQEEKRQEQPTTSKKDVEQALLTANYVLNQLKMPSMEAREVQSLQRHVQINQTAPEITEETVLQSKPQYQEFKFYYNLAESPITAVATVQAEELITQQCGCKNLVCACQQQCSAVELQSTQLNFAGSEGGQLFFAQVDVATHNLKMSRDLLTNQPEKRPVVKILPLSHRNRVLVVQEDGAITVFKLNPVQSRISLSLVYSGYPLGYFQVRAVSVSPNHELIALYGKTGTPLLLDLLTGRQILRSPGEKFNKVTEDDGFNALDLMGNVRGDTAVSASPAEVVDCCFLSEDRFAFVREDGTFQVLEIKQIASDRRGYEVEYAKFLQEKPTQLALFDQTLLITTSEKCLYACHLDQKLDTHQYRTEFDIFQVCAVQGQGFTCLSKQGHMFLFSDFENAEPKITMDWSVDTTGNVRLFTWNGFVIIADDSHIFTVDVTREDVKQGQIEGKVVSADVGEGVGLYGLTCGAIGMEQRIQATV